MGTYIVGGILVVIVAAVVYSLVHNKKKGKACSGCSGCDLAEKCGK
jgi:hypothetical protein